MIRIQANKQAPAGWWDVQLFWYSPGVVEEVELARVWAEAMVALGYEVWR